MLKLWLIGCYWLLLAFNSGKLRMIAFRSIEDHFTADEFSLKFRGKQYLIQPGSLCTDGMYVSVYTIQNVLLVFERNIKGSVKNMAFKRAMDIQNTKPLKFFMKPMIAPQQHIISGNKPTEVLFWDSLETGPGFFGLAMIHKPKEGNYFLTNPGLKVKYGGDFIAGSSDDELPEPISSFAVCIDRVGSILFSKSGFYYRAPPYYFTIKKNETFKSDEGTTVTFGMNDYEGWYAYLNIPQRLWDVKIGIVYVDLERKDSYAYSILFVENNADVYMMTFDINNSYGENMTGCLEVWTVRKIEGSLPGLIRLTTLKVGVLYATTDSYGTYSFRVENDKIKILQKFEPKRALWNERPLTSFLPKWKIFDGVDGIYAISEGDSKIFQNQFVGNKAQRYKSIDSGAILDIKIINGETLILKKNGLWNREKLTKPLSISHGIILESGELATVSNSKIVSKNLEVGLSHLVPDLELSVMQAIESPDGKLYVALGSCDGKAYLSGPEFKEALTLGSFVTSASIFMIGDIAVFLFGSDKGDVQVYVQGIGSELLMIGEGIVDFSNVIGNRIIAYNDQNVAQISFNEKAQVTEFCYLDIEPTSAIHLDHSGNLIMFDSGDNKLLRVNTEEVAKFIT